MFDPVQLQNDLAMALLSDDRLVNIAVKIYRKMRLQEETDWRLLINGRGPNGRSGSGILIPEPYANCHNPNVTGPVLEWLLPFVCIEQPIMSMNPVTGTLLSVTQLAQHVMDIVQLYADDNVGTVQLTTRPIEPEREFVFPGTVAYRVNCRLVGKSTQVVRCARVTSSIVAGVCTLSCAQAGAEICFTLDGSFPARNSAGINPSSMLYSAPFAVVSGQVLRTAAYFSGLTNSALAYTVVP